MHITQVYWHVSSPCPGDFEDHFAPIQSVEFIDFETSAAMQHGREKGKKKKTQAQKPVEPPPTQSSDRKEARAREKGGAGKRKPDVIYFGQAAVKTLLKRFGGMRM
eukprot:407469-Amorphochlora_amoeboformis.AAC.1